MTWPVLIANADMDERVRREVVRAIVGGWTRYFDGLAFALLLSAVFCGYLFSVGSTPVRDATVWFATFAAWSFAAYALRLEYLGNPNRFSAKRWEQVWSVVWGFQGLVSSSMAWWFIESGNPTNSALICIVILGVLVSNFYQLGASFMIQASSLSMIGVVTWSCFLWHDGEVNQVISVVFPIFVVFIVCQAWGMAKSFSDTIALRVANEIMAADLDKARIAAERASRSKSEFLANMSHELRTPLNAILGFSEMIELQPYGRHHDGRYGEYAGYIRSSGQHLLSLVDDILDISKIEAGQMQVRPENLSAAQLANDAAGVFRARAAASGLTLDVAASAASVFADRRAAHQILLNLLGNAIKFTPRGGRITITIQDSARGAEIKVADTGSGIDASDLPKLFEPFVQTDNTFARTKGGSGLGLALVRSLARLHGGDASIESVLGVGTTVTVWFPAQASASDSVSEAATQAA